MMKMKFVIRNALTVAVACLALVAVSAAVPEVLEAQNCSYCKSCSDCDRAWWGSTGCDFFGEDEDGKGCCQMTGEVCNPSLSLNVDRNDVRLVPTNNADSEETFVVRLDHDIFGTWTCGDGSLRVAYREAEDGSWVEIEGSEFAAYKEQYSLAKYVDLLGEDLAGRRTVAASPR